MRHALIINAHQKYDKLAEGKLTNSYTQIAEKFFLHNGFEVKTTNIEAGYDITEEVNRFEWAYYFVFQFPVYWMGMPWIAKKYIDEVFSAGRDISTFKNDGRKLRNLNGKYGTGGLMKGKRYMLSLTCNCPDSEFSNPAGFFDGLSIDDVHTPVHKIFQFCGATKRDTFCSADVYRGDLDIEKEGRRYLEILHKNFL